MKWDEQREKKKLISLEVQRQIYITYSALECSKVLKSTVVGKPFQAFMTRSLKKELRSACHFSLKTVYPNPNPIYLNQAARPIQ